VCEFSVYTMLLLLLLLLVVVVVVVVGKDLDIF
jgi:hypothetical protein